MLNSNLGGIEPEYLFKNCSVMGAESYSPSVSGKATKDGMLIITFYNKTDYGTLGISKTLSINGVNVEPIQIFNDTSSTDNSGALYYPVKKDDMISFNEIMTGSTLRCYIIGIIV